MSKIKYIAAILTSAALLLSACNQESASVPAQNDPPSVSSQEDKVPVLEETNSAALEQSYSGLHASSDEIDWDQVHDELLSNEMIAELHTAVDAIVNHDQESLEQIFGSSSGAALAYLMDHTTQFTDVDPAYIEGERMLVPVRGMRQLQGEDEVQEATLFFYFMKNSKGEWHLVTID